jgi:hypothetical protein
VPYWLVAAVEGRVRHWSVVCPSGEAGVGGAVAGSVRSLDWADATAIPTEVMELAGLGN